MIEVDTLGFTYPTAGAPVLHGLSFSIARGEVFGFLGPSGAGKSTTQKILIRLLKDYTGRVAVLGRELSTWGSAYYERIGVAFEFPTHFLKLTGAENLTYFGRLYDGPVRPAAEVLARVGLEADADTPVGQYSKGMKNRLSVARALVHAPELLFLDEPTAGLDPASARRIRDLIRAEQTAGRTIFLTTHDMTVADALCDRVALLVDGRIALVGRPRDLKLRYGEAKVRVEYAASGAVVDGADGTAVRDFPVAGLGENDAFLAILRNHPVETIHTLEATLEDVFLRATGRALE